MVLLLLMSVTVSYKLIIVNSCVLPVSEHVITVLYYFETMQN